MSVFDILICLDVLKICIVNWIVFGCVMCFLKNAHRHFSGISPCLDDAFGVDKCKERLTEHLPLKPYTKTLLMSIMSYPLGYVVV